VLGFDIEVCGRCGGSARIIDCDESYLIKRCFGQRLTWRTSCGIISVTTTIVELIPDVMALLQLIQAARRSLLSTTTGGRSIVADYFSCQWQLETGIRPGQVEHVFAAGMNASRFESI